MTAEEFKRHERQAYNAVAPKWAAHMAERTARFSSRLLELLEPRAGSRLLDLACGSGHLAAEAVSRFGCRVVALDLSEGMLAEARRRAPSAAFHLGDAEHLPFAAASFDVIASGLGLMYFPDAGRALAEIRRVLKPGGAAGFVVWPLARRIPCLALAMAAVTEVTATGFERRLIRLPVIGTKLFFRVVEERIPGRGPSPTCFGRPGKVEAALDAAGFQSPKVAEHSDLWRYASFDELWTSLMKSTPVQAGQQQLGREAVGEIRTRLESKCERFRDGGGYAFPMTALLATAAR